MTVIDELKAKIMQGKTPEDFDNIYHDMMDAYNQNYDNLEIQSEINNLWPLYDSCENAIYN